MQTTQPATSKLIPRLLAWLALVLTITVAYLFWAHDALDLPGWTWGITSVVALAALVTTARQRLWYEMAISIIALLGFPIWAAVTIVSWILFAPSCGVLCF